MTGLVRLVCLMGQNPVEQFQLVPTQTWNQTADMQPLLKLDVKGFHWSRPRKGILSAMFIPGGGAINLCKEDKSSVETFWLLSRLQSGANDQLVCIWINLNYAWLYAQGQDHLETVPWLCLQPRPDRGRWWNQDSLSNDLEAIRKPGHATRSDTHTSPMPVLNQWLPESIQLRLSGMLAW